MCVCSKRIKTLVDQITAHPEQFSKLQAVQAKVNVAKDVMLKNMETMMIRQDKLDGMVEKSDGLLDAVSAALGSYCGGCRHSKQLLDAVGTVQGEPLGDRRQGRGCIQRTPRGRQRREAESLYFVLQLHLSSRLVSGPEFDDFH